MNRIIGRIGNAAVWGGTMQEDAEKRPESVMLYGVEDAKHMTLEYAEQLRAGGAYLELDARGFVWVYQGREKEKMQKEMA